MILKGFYSPSSVRRSWNGWANSKVVEYKDYDLGIFKVPRRFRDRKGNLEGNLINWSHNSFEDAEEVSPLFTLAYSN